MNRTHLKIHLAIVAGVAALIVGVWIFNIIDFFKPMWLLALLALPLFTWLADQSIAGLPSRTNAVASTIRGLLYILVVVALADPQYVLKSNTLCVYFLLDHSASIPEKIREQELSFVNATVDHKGAKDLAGLIVFGEEPSIELIPSENLKVDTLHSMVNPNYTNLQAATELAVAAFPRNARKKIVLITDGNQNAGNVMDAVRYAAGEGVRMSVLPVDYALGNEVLVEKVQIPETVRENEPFEMRVHVNSLQETTGKLVLYRNGEQLGKAQPVKLRKGENRYFVEMKVDKPGFFVYTARIIAEEDTIPNNNEASNYVYIQGDTKILFVTSDGSDTDIQQLVEIAKVEGLKPFVISPEGFPTGIEQLQLYDCIVLANVAAGKFTDSQMTMIKTCVKDLGTGLIMIGGENSFGAGGYEQTPVEDALPVSMDIKQKKIVPKGALVLLLHTCEFAQGNFWAKEIAKAAIKAIHPRDEVGIVYYGNGDQWLFPLRPAVNKNFLYNKIDKCEPGDMPSFGPSFSMARKSLLASNAMVRHMIVISDGDPARPAPADIAALAGGNITVSTVGINPHSPRDVDVLKYIAYKTKGRYYFVKDPKKLPKIFVKEARVVKRSLIFNKPFQPLMVASSELTKGVDPREVPRLMAYVATTPKDRALVSMTSDNDNKDPVLVEWRYGLGKAVAFTSDASTNWGREWVPWPKYRRIWGQIIRWTTRKRETSNLSIRTRRDGDKVIMTIDAIDQSGRYINYPKLEARRVDSSFEGHRLAVRQVGAGRYQAEFNVRDTGVNIVNIAFTDPVTGRQGYVRTGLTMPYSPEFKQLTADIPLLRRVAQVGDPSGKLLKSDPALANIFQSDQPPSVNLQPVWEYLLVITILFFMVDVILRRVIISREDVRSVLNAALVKIGRGKGPVQHDETMSALLRRKQQVFRKKETVKDDGKSASSQPSAPAPDFKERLQKQAQTAPGPGQANAADLAESASDDSARPSSRSKSGSPPDLPGKGDAPQGDSYTSRLLDAKKRARKKARGEEDD